MASLLRSTFDRSNAFELEDDEFSQRGRMPLLERIMDRLPESVSMSACVIASALVGLLCVVVSSSVSYHAGYTSGLGAVPSPPPLHPPPPPHHPPSPQKFTQAEAEAMQVVMNFKAYEIQRDADKVVSTLAGHCMVIGQNGTFTWRAAGDSQNHWSIMFADLDERKWGHDELEGAEMVEMWDGGQGQMATVHGQWSRVHRGGGELDRLDSRFVLQEVSVPVGHMGGGHKLEWRIALIINP